ncbi:MAG TPA: dihydrodipicolinate synthase family protein [Rhodothermales bacterium]|nr:dihydrodipicolinate synthase family protein [Rhodothermales bacterium]
MPHVSLDWTGVLPAITTPFRDDLSVDHAFLGTHAGQLVDAGSRAIVALGSLGEGATLSFEEKEAVLRTCVEAVGARAPVVAAVSALSTDEAVRVAQMAERVGCGGLMVLPPYVYASDWREMRAHVDAVLRATDLPCMLYNNPIAYGTDFRPEQVAELAEAHSTLEAVKESSGDVRRVTALRVLLGDRLRVLVGLDDAVVEGVRAGAAGWVAGLVNALPRESVVLFERARRGEDVADLYAWFLPLLRLDTVVKFVQLIKLVQAEVGMGRERVRPPRLVLDGAEREAALALIHQALANRPQV